MLVSVLCACEGKHDGDSTQSETGGATHYMMEDELMAADLTLGGMVRVSCRRSDREGQLVTQFARITSASPFRKFTMFFAARSPCRSTDSSVRLATCGVTMMLSMPRNG